MKPKGWLVDSRPTVTPITASGTTSQMTAVCRRLLNRAIVIRTIAMTKIGILLASAPWASADDLYSPHHSSR